MTHTYAAYKSPISQQRPTQSESEGLETDIPTNWTGKISQGSNTHIGQIDFKKRAIKRDPEGQFIILKQRIHQEDINIGNIYAPKYIKKILEDFKKDIDSTTLILGDLNTSLSTMDRSSTQRINKDIVALNNALDEMDLTDI